MRAPPFWPPDCSLVRVPFINFHIKERPEGPEGNHPMPLRMLQLPGSRPGHPTPTKGPCSLMRCRDDPSPAWLGLPFLTAQLFSTEMEPKSCANTPLPRPWPASLICAPRPFSNRRAGTLPDPTQGASENHGQLDTCPVTIGPNGQDLNDNEQ